MNSEKAELAELAADQASLPPNYAPSEVFTESPPPAYRKSAGTTVRVAKLVCFTALAITFLVGFFVISHKWIQSQQCNCPVQDEFLQRSEALVAQAPAFLPLADNQILESSIDQQKEVEENLNDLKEEEIMLPEQVLSDEIEVKPQSQESPLNEDEILEEVKNEFQQKIKLPIDLLLGNSELAGRDVQCNVEKRRQKIADGIFTEAIIVTCDNDDDTEELNIPPPQMKKFLPPMSLLGDIMKALASRPTSSGEQDIPRPLFPRPNPEGRMAMRGPFPFPVIRPIQGPMNDPFSPNMLRFVPLNRAPQHMPEMRQLPFQRIPMPPPHMGLHPVRVIKRITMNPVAEFNDPMQTSDSGPEIRPISIFNSLPPPIAELNPLAQPRPQVRIIRIPNSAQHQPGNGHHNEGRPPFQMNPFLNMMPSRVGRVLRIVPLNQNNFHENSFNNEEEEESFDRPVPGSLLPLEPRPFRQQEHFHEESEPVPEASGRSLPSPRVNFPGLRLFRLPGRPPLFPFPDARVMTHMQLQNAPEEHEDNDASENFPPQMLPLDEGAEQEQDFGPPRTHTVLESAPEPIFRNDAHLLNRPPQPEQFHGRAFQPHQEPFEERPTETFQDEPMSQPQFQPRFFAPPPRFAPEGRSSPFAEINTDAEMVHTEEQPQSFQQQNHHVILN